ncbi:hypothetical protein A9Q91_05950 [Candidatus Gracilibacteria bacterium 28_42_T64]|nr:hypothetical protein A9Q91_05950 [Candidatus Gracilibacteria bacterium 28_42_T64]
MKKQYIFLIMIAIILYILYLIGTFTYKEYKINGSIEYISKLNIEIKERNKLALEIIEYKKSKAYRNMILKQQLSFKNKGEKVVYLTSEQKYNKYVNEVLPEEIDSLETNIEDNIVNGMTIFEKWIYFLFKIDTR